MWHFIGEESTARWQQYSAFYAVSSLQNMCVLVLALQRCLSGFSIFGGAIKADNGALIEIRNENENSGINSNVISGICSCRPRPYGEAVMKLVYDESEAMRRLSDQRRPRMATLKYIM